MWHTMYALHASNSFKGLQCVQMNINNRGIKKSSMYSLYTLHAYNNTIGLQSMQTTINNSLSSEGYKALSDYRH